MAKGKDDLKLKQERFCQLYATEVEFFGNGVETYLKVYDIDRSKPNWYKSACSASSRLLSNVKVIDRISELLEEQGLNDVFVDKQLKFLLTQYADFNSKLGAIREYNKLKQRIIEKSEVKLTTPKPLLYAISNNHGNKKDIESNEED
jgi:hypothetical protein